MWPNARLPLTKWSPGQQCSWWLAWDQQNDCFKYCWSLPPPPLYFHTLAPNTPTRMFLFDSLLPSLSGSLLPSLHLTRRLPVTNNSFQLRKAAKNPRNCLQFGDLICDFYKTILCLPTMCLLLRNFPITSFDLKKKVRKKEKTYRM